MPKRPSRPVRPALAKSLLLRYAAEQRVAWERAAQRDGRTLSDWLRRAADAAALEQGP